LPDGDAQRDATGVLVDVHADAGRRHVHAHGSRRRDQARVARHALQAAAQVGRGQDQAGQRAQADQRLARAGAQADGRVARLLDGHAPGDAEDVGQVLGIDGLVRVGIEPGFGQDAGQVETALRKAVLHRLERAELGQGNDDHGVLRFAARTGGRMHRRISLPK